MAIPYASAVQPPPYYQPKVRFGWIGESWQLFSANAGVWIGAMAIYLALYLGLTLASSYVVNGGVLTRTVTAGTSPVAAAMHTYGSPLYWLQILVLNLTNAFFTAGMLRIANAQMRGEQASVGMLFQGGPVILPMFAYTFVMSLAAGIGFLLLLAPGFAVYGIYAPGLALIADGVGFSAAFKRSGDAMSRDWASAMGLAFVVLLLVGAGSVLTCGLGFFVFLPMQMLILSLAYRDMIGMPRAYAGTGAGYNPYGQAAAPGTWPPAPGAAWPPPPPPVGGPPQPQPPLAGAPPANGYAPPAPPAGAYAPPGDPYAAPPADPYAAPPQDPYAPPPSPPQPPHAS